MVSRLIAAVVVALCLGVAPASGRSWKAATGQFSVDAELVELRDDTVYLRRSDGQLLKIQLDQLSAADRDFVRQQSAARGGVPQRLAPQPVVPRPMAPAPNVTAQHDGPLLRLEPAKWNHCMTEFDANRVIKSGNWFRSNIGGISVSSGQHSKLSIPIAMVQDRDYDLQVTFARLTGDEAIVVPFLVAGSHAQFVIDGWHSTVSGLQLINGKDVIKSSLSKRGPRLRNGKSTTVDISVRVADDNLATIDIQIDNQPEFHYALNARSIRPDAGWDLPNGMGLGAHQSSAVFYYYKIKPNR